jgi:Fis family transcriptional regulator
MMRETDLAVCVRSALEAYFRDLDGEQPHAVYDMLIHCIEKPLLESIMHRAGGNQSKAAEILGLNRNTLRKKLKQHNIQ